MRRKMITVGCVFAVAALPWTLHAAQPAFPHSPQPLNLRSPEITRLFSAEQIEAILSRTVDSELERIEVEAPRLGDLPLEDNSDSDTQVIFKSVARWLAPSQSYAARVNFTPDATDPLRPAAWMQSNYHVSFSPPASQR